MPKLRNGHPPSRSGGGTGRFRCLGRTEKVPHQSRLSSMKLAPCRARFRSQKCAASASSRLFKLRLQVDVCCDGRAFI